MHFKIYPIVFAMVFYCHLAGDGPFLNLRSIRFGLVAAASFLGFTLLFFRLYGFECLYESLLYHLVRKDHRCAHQTQLLAAVHVHLPELFLDQQGRLGALLRAFRAAARRLHAALQPRPRVRQFPVHLRLRGLQQE